MSTVYGGTVCEDSNRRCLYTHTTSNTTCLPCNDDNDSGSDSDYEDALSENDELDDEESSICRKIKIHLNEIDIPDWTSTVFDRLR